MNKTPKTKGFISLIITIVIALALAKYYFDFNIIDFLNSPKVVEVWTYIKKFFEIIWGNFIAEPFFYVWNEIIIGLFWKWIVIGFDIFKGWVDANK